MQFYRKLEPVLNVAATGHFTHNSKKVLGNVIERVDYVLGGGSLTKAMLSNLSTRLNGKTTYGLISGSDLDLVNRYKNLINDAARLSFDFTELPARAIQGQLMGALDTDASGVTDFTIEGDITGATTPSIDPWVQMRTPGSMSAERGFDQRLRGLINVLIPTSVNDSAAGQFPHDVNYGAEGNTLVKRVFVFSSVLTHFEVRRDSLVLFEDVPAATAEYGAELAGRLWQSGLYVYDPIQDGNQPDTIPTRVQNAQGQIREAAFEWLFRVSGSGTHRVFVDGYTTLRDL